MSAWYYNKHRYDWIDNMDFSEKMYWIVKFRHYMNEFFNATVTPEVPNMDDIVTYCSRKADFQKRFWNKAVFHHFMREMHNQKYLRQIIPNCHVDTSCHNFYKWDFYRPSRKARSRDSILTNNTTQVNDVHIENYKIVTADGTRLRSAQELYIYERLIEIPNLKVLYEEKFRYKTDYKLPDFTIIIDEGAPYIWEHFGMTEDEGYFYNMETRSNGILMQVLTT